MDGPFLRLIAESRKNTAGAVPTPRTGTLDEGRGIGVGETVAAVRAYISEMRRLVTTHGAPPPVTGSTAPEIGITRRSVRYINE
ncbi:hypothetical protein [Paenirhodobacter enshiensis]|uniref:hypothetical protein n=1 Tax=Paenirhodobacter enshiensis TaxID=1105367 RepID=UPI003FA3081E